MCQLGHDSEANTVPGRTLVGSVRVCAHLEDDVHKRGRLRNLPVDTRRACSGRRLGKVDDEVAHAPEEVVLVNVPLCASTTRDVWVHICKGVGQ